MCCEEKEGASPGLLVGFSGDMFVLFRWWGRPLFTEQPFCWVSYVGIHRMSQSGSILLLGSFFRL